MKIPGCKECSGYKAEKNKEKVHVFYGLLNFYAVLLSWKNHFYSLPTHIGDNTYEMTTEPIKFTNKDLKNTLPGQYLILKFSIRKKILKYLSRFLFIKNPL